ncbi:flavin reductase family protein [Marinomonas spartinae]|uniref:flavin reductase family protein n=1 Tax=Marinomonas spartinae TaxID=1792290 RepID=UPI0018F1C997|nr:flavin reductase family protein [Marinomonas spartinae]MBJ7555986.1 flavin reductase family protein [Marinomonas spartinae]
MNTSNVQTINSTPAVEVPLIDTRELRNTFGMFATGVTAITALGENGQLVGITANSFSSLSLDPAQILWSLVLTSPNVSAFDEGKYFNVNILSQSQEGLAMQMATRSEDKFAGVQYCLSPTGVPLLEEALATLQCQVEFTRVSGDHLLIVGRVLDFDRVEEGEPLVFYRGRFK